MDIGSIAICITIGALIVFASIGIGVCYGRCDKGQLNDDSDVRTYVPVRDRSRSRDNRRIEQVEPEEIELVLYNLRIGASDREKRVIDYLIDTRGMRNEE